MSTRGVRFLSRQPLVGGNLYHDAVDRKEALAQLRGDFDRLHADLANAVPVTAPIAVALAPTFDAFDDFYTAETTHTLAPWITEWSVFEAWKERVAWARMAARAAGVPLGSPEPTNLPKTMWERGQDGTGSGTDRAFVFGRDLFKLGLGVAAVIGIWKFGRKVWRVLEAESKAIAELAEEAAEHEDEAVRDREHHHHERHHEREHDDEISDAELVE